MNDPMTTDEKIEVLTKMVNEIMARLVDLENLPTNAAELHHEFGSSDDDDDWDDDWVDEEEEDDDE